LPNAFNFARKQWIAEVDQKVIEESVHSEKSTNWQPFFKGGLDIDGTARNIEAYWMNPSV